jgi:hypothetical protein
MRRIALRGAGALALLLAADMASAQSILPGTSPYAAPPPPPLPIPKITVTPPPKFDAPATPALQAPQRPSFGDRVQGCLDAGAAAGYGPSDREVYARSCANR